MTAREFKNKLSELKIAPKDFGDLTGYSQRTLRAWGRTHAVPIHIRILLNILVDNESVRLRFKAGNYATGSKRD